MINMKERKLGLFIQTQQLMKELDKLRRQDYEELQLPTRTGRGEFVNLIDLITSFNSKGNHRTLECHYISHNVTKRA